jgi:leucyl aminopeptidase
MLLHNTTFEKYWELPLNNFYKEKTKWTISDLKNLTEWMFAWSTMWGAFLSNFCLHNEKFTHIDIAWVSFVKEKYGLYNIWATGFGVDSLSQWLIK